jgi:4-amino-4-deoxy-L-arabinose transferase-like glycosyltransferase
MEADRSPNAFLGHNRAILIGGAACVTLYLGLVLGLAITKLPGRDEAWFSSPGLALITNGTMTTPVLEHVATWHHGLDRHTYWMPPLHFLVTAAWFKVFGFGIVTLRSLSAMWGLIALAAWFVFMARVTHSSTAGFAATVLVSLDYFFLVSASDGRMDMMCHALYATAMALYVSLRESRLGHAVFWSQTLVVGAGLTHPSGLIGFACVAVLVIYYHDLSRLTVRHWLLAATPYALGAAGWGFYILQDPHLFVNQFFGNARVAAAASGSVTNPWSSPLLALKAEVTRRYLPSFGLGPEMPLMNRFKGVILVTYALGWLGTLLMALRRSTGPAPLLFSLTLTTFLVLTVSPSKYWYYLVHITPFLACCLALSAVRVAAAGRGRQLLALSALSVLLILEGSGVVYRIATNPMGRLYDSVVACVERHSDSGDLVMGNASLLFRLWPTRRTLDDYNLGYYTGHQAAVIVVDGFDRAMQQGAQQSSPKVFAHVTRLLQNDFRLVCDFSDYQVYRRAQSWRTELRSGARPAGQ